MLTRRKWERSVDGVKDRQHKLVVPVWMHPDLPRAGACSSFHPSCPYLSSWVSTGKTVAVTSRRLA